MESIDAGMADALRTDIRRLDNLGRNLQEDLLNRIQKRHPKKQRIDDTPKWKMEVAIFASEEGIGHFRSEINELVNVKMKDNARAIGEAAEKGDLSENAEYKFALEERDLLRARLAQMNDQMAKAQSIQPEDVPTDQVGIGSVVTLKNVESSDSIDVTFLSPFESNVDRLIYNYKSPLGQEFMGKKLGDTVELPMNELKGTYTITALRPWR
jgi:transcription elongation GreA/GreB family factor